jgi:hypothetical protein
MKKKYRLTLDIEVSADEEVEFGVVETNLNLLAEMANNFGLFTDGSTAELDGYTTNVTTVKRGRPKKAATAK